jgi:hypothetical protein
MCKPSVTVLPLHSDGPCSFSVRSYTDACGAFSLGWSWRTKIANVLRVWADKAEGAQSLVIVASGPSQIVQQDVIDAAVVGFNGATQYLNDLWRERVFGSADREVAQVQPGRPIQ